jgi:hypothetical protein
MSTFHSREIRAFRLEPGMELVAALTAYCKAHEIEQGLILGLGAVRNPEIGSYAFEERAYHYLQLEGDWELLTLNANVSLKDGEPFLHPHVIVANSSGQVRGGHVLSAEVLVAEIYLHVLDGEPLEREPDSTTGLILWPPLDVAE